MHNLKAVNLELEANQLICFTGISGSGKSSLAFDTLFVEGQRRYVESLSAHARRFLGDLPKPDVESISGISPTISIEQKTAGRNPRSTVGTLTELYDYLRVLYARVAIPHCPVSGERVKARTVSDIVQEISTSFQHRQVIILAPAIRGKKGTLQDDLEEISKKGFTRARIDGELYHLSDEPQLKKSTTHDLDIVIDRLEVDDAHQERLQESLTVALQLAENTAIVYDPTSKEEQLYSTRAFSPRSGLSYSSLEPHDFSFNSPQGMCPDCQGMGMKQEFQYDKVIDPEKSIAEDCCSVASSYSTVRYKNIYDNLARIYDFSVNTPWKELSCDAQKIFLHGTAKKWTKMYFVHPTTKAVWVDTIWWRGVLTEAHERYIAAKSESYKRKVEKLMNLGTCPTCLGSRIKAYPAAALFHEVKIHDVVNMTIQQAYHFFDTVTLSQEESLIGSEIVKEIRERLRFLLDVGLDYLQLSRSAPSLSGGEAQRVRLASQIGSGLVGVTYILDEPSIGLHPRDNKKLIESLRHLQSKGNTVIIVEHDEETIRAVDHIVDFGPKAGINGGEIVFQGSVAGLLKNRHSLTAAYLSRKKTIGVSTPRKKVTKKTAKLTLHNATHHNLKNVRLDLPLGCFVAITGVSGSGKSSLFLETLYPALYNALMDGDLPTGAHGTIEGLELIDKVIDIDQSPIGRTPRSNPATYISLFDDIRELFANLAQSKSKGFTASRFSFNVKEGTCSECKGAGVLKIEMDFLEDSSVICPLCQGKRFDEETLEIRYKEKNIQDILEMDVKEALVLFENVPQIRSKLALMDRVGLDYMKLGQPSTTLSGGEAQRLKLARELVRPSTGKTLYILDEPTTGLHFHDINNLLAVLHALVEKGNSVCVIEHNMDLVKTADWVIDMGPESGEKGGTIVQEGTPEDIASSETPTGIALKAAIYPEKIETAPTTAKPHKVHTHLVVTNATHNNLQNVCCTIEHEKMTCVIGPSGSGKSSLAFDTIYAEGQRRYVESLSSYVRQFVKQLPKPQVGKIEGLAPTIAIEQRLHASNPRSTVGTMTEIYDYLRLLYARVGQPHCPKSGYKIQAISKETVVDRLLSFPEKTKLVIMAPVDIKNSASLHDELAQFRKLGFLRMRLNADFIDLSDEEQKPTYNPKKKNRLSLVVDRVHASPSHKARLFEACRVAAHYGKNQIAVLADDKELFFNLSFAVEETGESYPEITPKSFAFNTQEGMCHTCQGLGQVVGFALESWPQFEYRTVDEIIEQLTSLSSTTHTSELIIHKICAHFAIDTSCPLHYLPQEHIKILFYGSDETMKCTVNSVSLRVRWRGLNHAFALAFQYLSVEEESKNKLLALSEARICPDCSGSRINALARHVTIHNRSISHACAMTLPDLLAFIQTIPAPSKHDHALVEVFGELKSRLGFLIEIGLHYLSLDRAAETLSGGEEQRVRLARQIGSGLTQVLYILDEPTIGLHPLDIDKLTHALKRLQQLGNTLLIVEHDPQLINQADYLLELGPGSGKKEGGHLQFAGSPQELKKKGGTATAPYLLEKKSFLKPPKRITCKKFLHIHNATIHNLNNLSVSLPLNRFVTVTGVSGSGKSTLIFDVLLKELLPLIQKKTKTSSLISGHEKISKVIVVDQQPIGHTVRSDVATYLDVLTPLRGVFAQMPEARAKGLVEKHFSYFTRSGMCRSCQGLGYKRVYLHFLPTVHVPCTECHGFRLQKESLSVRFQEKHMGEILSMSAKELLPLFQFHPIIYRQMLCLIEVGLEYLPLCQEMHTLSAGEAQRMKLAYALASRHHAHILYLLDEPTTGLHPQEVEKMISIMKRLVQDGHSVIAIEHNTCMIEASDWIIDIGPGAASDGGKIVAEGPPEVIAKQKKSITGRYLKL